MIVGRRAFAALAAAIVVLAAACGRGEEPSRATATPNPELPQIPTSEHPYTASITSPLPDDPVYAPKLTIAVTVFAFDVVDKLGEKAKAGQGHIHYYMDVDEIPTDPGKPAVTDDKRTYHAEATTFHVWDVNPGKHTFAIQLVNNDHTPLEPPVTDEITVDVKPASARPSPHGSTTPTPDSGTLPRPSG